MTSSNRSFKKVPVAVALLVLAATVACTPAWQTAPHHTLYQKAPQPNSHPIPEEIEPTEWVPSIWYSSFAQVSRGLSPGYHLQGAVGGPEALDVNHFGKVPDSTWFENRIGRRPMSVAEIRRGPNVNPPPNLDELVVMSGKIGGVTPGFIVKDANGARWIVKFDHPAFPQLASGAEIVGTKIMHAVGYHVPENYALSFNVDQLKLDPDATTRDRYNNKVPYRWKDLRDALALLNPGSDGMVHALFSRLLPGIPLGPTPLTGTRADDPNDQIPHVRRRTLRGLWVFYAWINNTDAKYTNTLDMFQVTNEQTKEGYVRHYLIDFGTSFGGAPGGPKPRHEGYEYKVDWAGMGQRLATLGIQYPYWATVHGMPFRSVGNYEAEVFDPARWKPKYPNPVFDAADAHDTFWAASILARFGPLEIAAAVSAADYSERGAAAWLAETALVRRNKLLRYAFRNMAPLDDPEVTPQGQLELTDLELLAGLERAEDLEYVWQLDWHSPSSRRAMSASTSKNPAVSLVPLVHHLRSQVGNELLDAPFLTVTWQRRVRGGPLGPKLEVHLRVLESGRVIPVGLEREVG